MDYYVIEKHSKGPLEKYRTDFYYDKSVGKGQAQKCPRCGEFISMLPSLRPLNVHLETWGDDFGDVAFGQNDILVSDRFKEAFKHSNLRGLQEFENVEIISHKNYGARMKSLPKYFRAIPTQYGARIDVQASEVEWRLGREPKCDFCLGGIVKRWQRIVLDEHSWNGDDIFYAYGVPADLIASRRFFDWATEGGFRNLNFEPAADSNRDFYPWESKPSL